MAPLGTANEPRNAAGAEDQPVVGPARDAVPSVHDTRDQEGRFVPRDDHIKEIKLLLFLLFSKID